MVVADTFPARSHILPINTVRFLNILRRFFFTKSDIGNTIFLSKNVLHNTIVTAENNNESVKRLFTSIDGDKFMVINPY